MKERLTITRTDETFVTLRRGAGDNQLYKQHLTVPPGLADETIESIILALGFATRIDGKLFTDSFMGWVQDGLEKVLDMMYGSRYNSQYPNGDLLSRPTNTRYLNTRQWFRKELGNYDAIDDAIFAKLPDWKIAALVVRLSTKAKDQFEEEFDFRDDRCEVRIDKIRDELFSGFLSTHQELIEAEAEDDRLVRDDAESLGWGARSDRAAGPD